MSLFEAFKAVFTSLWLFWLLAGLTIISLGIAEAQEKKAERHQRMMRSRKEYYTPHER